MAPVTGRRAAALPTVISLSKLFHLVPAAFSARNAKRNTMWAATTAMTAAGHGGGEDAPENEADYLFTLLLSIFLVLLGGVFAGLTLALMGSDDLNLRVLATSSSDPKVRRDANRVLRLLRRGRHWVLVVLLLSNVIVNESLPIFLDKILGGGFAAVVVSTIMIVIFGEVIPQAVCVRYGLAIGGACAPLVHFMMVFFAPIAWPIAKLLDWVLGHDVGHTYKKAELKSFLQFHREGEEPLRDDEIAILNGVLSLNERRVNQIMTPIEDCLILPSDKVLDHDAVDQILISGFSRIPVHEPGQPDNFIGMLLVKRLITYNPEDKLPVSKFPLHPLPEANPDLNCFQAIDYFQTGRAHLLLVSNTPGRRGGALGIISLEDLIEEIIGEEIIDETDRYQDNHSKRKAQRRATQEIMRGIIERQRVINAFSRRASSRDHSPAPHGSMGREGVLVSFTTETHHEPGEMVSSPLKNTVALIEDEPAPAGLITDGPDDSKTPRIVETELGESKDPAIPDPIPKPNLDPSAPESQANGEEAKKDAADAKADDKENGKDNAKDGDKVDTNVVPESSSATPSESTPVDPKPSTSQNKKKKKKGKKGGQ